MFSLRRTTVSVLKLARLHRPVVSIILQYHKCRAPLTRWNNQRTWPSRAKHFYSFFIKLNSLCFDIGANTGSKTEVFRRLGANVVAVEPQPKCVKLLLSRWQKDTKVIVCQSAAGSKTGNTKMFVNDGVNQWSSLSKDWIWAMKHNDVLPHAMWNRTIDVRLVTLDDLIRIHGLPDFCKIDTEGYEYEVLKGLSVPIKYLSFEYHLKFLEPTMQSIDYLLMLNMRYFNYSPGESMKFGLKRWVSANEMKEILRKLPDWNINVQGDIYVACDLPR